MDITTLSENALYYFGKQELKNKLILIEDMDGADNGLYPLRELQSKRSISKTVVHKNTKGETRTVSLKVEGPVSVGGCTTKEKLYEDNSNRSFLIHIDESKEQDERIMNYQRKLSAGSIDREEEKTAAKLLKNVQRILLPVAVRNPFAESLKLPSEVFKPRRTNTHYLQFIEAITFYHQRQRPQRVIEETGEIYIETTLEDIENANKLLKEILLRKSDELSGACRNYFEALKTHLNKEEKKDFMNREIRQALRLNANNQKRWMKELYDKYYIRRKEGSKERGFRYEILEQEEYEQLKNSISNGLDTVLSQIKQVNGSIVGQMAK